MNQITVPIIDGSVCLRHYKTFYSDQELCAGVENGGKDWCDVCMLIVFQE